MPVGNLPPKAKRMWEHVYQSAKGPGCDEGCAAAQAWSQVKKHYKKSGSKWVPKSTAIIDDLKQAMKGPDASAVYEKSEAGFLEDGGVLGNQCGECEFFKPGGGSCVIVKGRIDASDVCNFFEPGVWIGNMDSVFAKSRTIDMFISKASQDPESGEKRWAAVASDTDLDAFGDRMSLDLYQDFLDRIESGEPAPPVFASEVWRGGMPYLGIAHYLDLDGEAIVGDPSAVYVDGNRLKAKGTFRSTPLGDAAFEAVKADQQNGIENSKRVRISIAFVDWGHDHGEDQFIRESLTDDCPMCAEGQGDKIYKSGHLVHLALTRVPVNERTPIWLEERAMTTMKEDALAVLGEENEDLVEELDALSRKKKKQGRYRSAAVVVKSEEEDVDDEKQEKQEGPEAELTLRTGPFGGAVSFDEVEKYIKDQDEVHEIIDHFQILDSILFNINTSDEILDRPAAMSQAVSDFKARVDTAVKRSLAVRAAKMILETETEEGEPMAEEKVVEEEKPKEPETPTEAATPLDRQLDQLRSAVLEAAHGDGPIEERLKTIQPAFNSLADTVKSTVKGEEVANAEAIASAVATAVSSQLGPLTEAIQLLAEKSQASGPKPESPMVPGPRAYQPPPVNLETGEKDTKSPLTRMIRKSVGLKE